MTKPKQDVLTQQVEPERPHRLVLHFDAGPKTAHSFFGAVLRSARQLPGLREVALELSESGDLGKEALNTIGAAAVQSGFELSATVQAQQVFSWGAEAFAACRQVDLRVDARRYPALKLAPEVYQAAERLQAEARVVGFQVLLDRDLIGRLTLSRLRTWLERADFVTLTAPRHTPPDFTHSDLVKLFDRLSPLWESADRFFHLQIDRSIKPAFFPWNLLSVTCPAADLALNLEAGGRLFLGAARAPFAHIEHPARFADTVEGHLARAAAEVEGLRLDAR